MKSSDPAERERFREKFISVVRVIGGQWMLLNERKTNPELGGQAGQLGPERLAAQGLFTPRRAFASERTRDPAEGRTRLEAVLEEECGAQDGGPWTPPPILGGLGLNPSPHGGRMGGLVSPAMGEYKDEEKYPGRARISLARRQGSNAELNLDRVSR